jgi:hypothetical protein
MVTSNTRMQRAVNFLVNGTQSVSKLAHFQSIYWLSSEVQGYYK